LFCHIGFAHFAFATINFDILLLSHFLPMRGDRKIKTLRKWAKATLHRFHFVFAPQGKTMYYQELAGQKQNGQKKNSQTSIHE
jgi:hypothetical protein